MSMTMVVRNIVRSSGALFLGCAIALIWASAIHAQADTTAPMIKTRDIVLATSNPTGTTVAYTAADVSAFDDVDPEPTIACDPPSGSFFPRGVTTVTCTASDVSGNVSEPASFDVIVGNNNTDGVNDTDARIDSILQDPTQAKAAGRLSYIVQVNNRGPSEATDVVLMLTLPTQTTFVAANENCDAADFPVVRCTFTELPQGGRSSVEIKLRVNDEAVNPLAIDAVLQTRPGQTDLEPANNTLRKESPVEPLPAPEPPIIVYLPLLP